MPAFRNPVAVLCLLAAGATMSAPGDQPVPPLPPSAQPSAMATRSASLPARGLFDGDRLSASGRMRLAELIREARELQVEVVLLVPTGPWRIDEKSGDEPTLTAARLDSVRRFVAERGVDAQRIYVESRIDQKLAEPRLDVQVVGRDALD